MSVSATLSLPINLRNPRSKRFFGNRQIEHRQNIKDHGSTGARSLAIIFGLIVALVVFYLFEVNKVNTIGYDIKGYETKLVELKKESEILKLKAAGATSIYKLDSEASTLGMVDIKDAGYMTVRMSETAKR